MIKIKSMRDIDKIENIRNIVENIKMIKIPMTTIWQSDNVEFIPIYWQSVCVMIYMILMMNTIFKIQFQVLL